MLTVALEMLNSNGRFARLNFNQVRAANASPISTTPVTRAPIPSKLVSALLPLTTLVSSATGTLRVPVEANAAALTDELCSICVAEKSEDD